LAVQQRRQPRPIGRFNRIRCPSGWHCILNRVADMLTLMGRPYQLGQIVLDIVDEEFWPPVDLSRTPVYVGLAGDAVLLDRWSIPKLADLLALFDVGAETRYAISVKVADRPILDGYLTCLTLKPSSEYEQSASAADIVHAFVAAELVDEDRIEDHLRELHGDMNLRQDPLLRWLDYPVFDNGTMAIGFGFTVYHNRMIRVWSRAIHHHK
jgi:hypothetical protein